MDPTIHGKAYLPWMEGLDPWMVGTPIHLITAIFPLIVTLFMDAIFHPWTATPWYIPSMDGDPMVYSIHGRRPHGVFHPWTATPCVDSRHYLSPLPPPPPSLPPSMVASMALEEAPKDSFRGELRRLLPLFSYAIAVFPLCQ